MLVLMHMLVVLVGVAGWTFVFRNDQMFGKLWSRVLIFAFAFCIGHGATSLVVMLLDK